jgi:hypothetical protein
MELCAVVGCENEGRRQRCPIDGRVHGHGRVHYPRDAEDRETWGHHLTFRPYEEGWCLMCDMHMAVLRQQVESRRQWYARQQVESRRSDR